MDRSQQVRALTGELGLPLAVTLRPWTVDDFPAIERLSSAEGWPTPRDRPEAALAGWQHSWPALVAVADGTVIGFLRALSDGAITIYVAEILVAPAWRGQGIAAAMLTVAQHLSPGARIDLLATETSAPFYEREGFRPFCGYRRIWDRERRV